MRYFDHEDLLGSIVHHIADAPIADAYPPNTFFAFNFNAPVGPRVSGQVRNSGDDAILDGPVETP
jgi:hypothetical protein